MDMFREEWFFRFLLDQEKNPREEFIEPYIKYLKIISKDKFLKILKKNILRNSRIKQIILFRFFKA